MANSTIKQIQVGTSIYDIEPMNTGVLTASDVTSALGYTPLSSADNQTVKGNGTAFGANAAVDIVGGNNITVTGDATNNKITISGTGDTHYTSTWSVYAGTTCISTFNQSANRSITFKAGDNITLTGTANSGIITISASAPAATGYAGNLPINSTQYYSGTQYLAYLYGYNANLQIIASSTTEVYTHDLNIEVGASDTSGYLGIGASGYAYYLILHPDDVDTDGWWLECPQEGYLSISGLQTHFNNTVILKSSVYHSGNYIYGTAAIYPNQTSTYDIGGSTSRYNTIHANHLSIVGTGQTYITNSYISIYASSYNDATNYSAILLSASAANARISLYANGSIYLSATNCISLYTPKSIYIYTNGSNISLKTDNVTYGSIYLSAAAMVSITASKSVSITAANNSMTLKAYSSMTLETTSTVSNGLWFKQGAASSLPIVCGWEHDIKFWCSGRWCVRFSIIDTLGYAAIRTTTAISTSTQMSAGLSSLAAMLYYNGYSGYEYNALPVCAATATAGLATNGTPIAIYATGTGSTNLYFVIAANTNSASTAQIAFSTTGASSSGILYDHRRKIQYYNT